jgi:excinuclease UvrABC ATPase subunit
MTYNVIIMKKGSVKDNRKDQRIEIRLTKFEKEMFQAVADFEGINVSQYIREASLENVKAILYRRKDDKSIDDFQDGKPEIRTMTGDELRNFFDEMITKLNFKMDDETKAELSKMSPDRKATVLFKHVGSPEKQEDQKS